MTCHSRERKERKIMTETEARKQYKREWARRNREKMRESERRFYEKKAIEYEAADAIASKTAWADKAAALKRAIWQLEDKIANPKSAIPEWIEEKERLEIEYQNTLQEWGKADGITPAK